MAALTPDLPQVETLIIERTNAFRAEQSLAPVKPDPALTAAARAFANFLAHSTKFSHEADGRKPSDRVQAAGYEFCRLAENIASNLDSRGFKTEKLANDAVEGWKDSPPHREAMLLPYITQTGVAVAKAPNEEKYLSVQLFARPETLRYTLKIRNAGALTVHATVAGKSEDVDPHLTISLGLCDPVKLHFDGAGKKFDFNVDGAALYLITGKSAVDLKIEKATDLKIEKK